MEVPTLREIFKHKEDYYDQEVTVGIRPEGFVLQEDGPLVCNLSGVEVMGRDISVVSTHPDCEAKAIRSIINAENRVDTSKEQVRFALKPNKVHLFSEETEERIYFENKDGKMPAGTSNPRSGEGSHE